jgi:hypothetical protein
MYSMSITFKNLYLSIQNRKRKCTNVSTVRISSSGLYLDRETFSPSSLFSVLLPINFQSWLTTTTQ